MLGPRTDPCGAPLISSIYDHSKQLLASPLQENFLSIEEHDQIRVPQPCNLDIKQLCGTALLKVKI